ncbi:DNA replication and repair protein RecF [Vibrio aerogenes CECT 7868]|uniref:DNA replication and repair protein RecF n=1 Tax=Vibrio aerogenes CECT 7868 TaxID=1216006 RepID=A0A1M5ZTZ1_9VIBR|nr:ATP-dependent endonuclease [Vibrio aerogenes]SHI27608.1 DNA replication and repair protein RecF [Vibrio aerogenes CECT 7868]
MQLERIEISGFRGIRRLSLNFNELTTLIGENTWGKSSLLDALTIALPPDGALYEFTIRDFHVDYSISLPQTQSLQIVLSFITTEKGEIHSGRYKKLKPVWQKLANGQSRIIYRITGTREDEHIRTQYSFMDLNGDKLALHASEKLAQELSSLHPVLRMKDSRRFHSVADKKYLVSDKKNTSQNVRTEKRINNTCRRLLAIPGHVNKGEMKSSLNAVSALVGHYFSFKNRSNKPAPQDYTSLIYASPSSEKTFSQFVEETKNRQTRLLLMILMNAYLQAKGPTDLRRCARPVLIIEDPEGRLHPTHLARAWSLLQFLPMQKILTTNSGELLAAVPINSIRRLVRYADKTHTLAIPDNILSPDELRRIGFHIRFHRSNALFARCWLLVEGETEVWLFSELARQCGYNLMAEGIQIIEFAQSGLRPLIKIAKALAIDWHVITDGDSAGKKYATTVRKQLSQDLESHRLTTLPDRDIEHYLYDNGFEFFFKDLLKIPHNHPIPAKKVVIKVLKKYAKPDLALAILSYCEQQGTDVIPPLLRKTIKRVVLMAKENT